MDYPQSEASESLGVREHLLDPGQHSFPPGNTTTQGDPAARTFKKERNIIVIPPHRLSDLNLVHYLLQKQQRGYLVQTHIVTEGGRLVLGVRAYPKSHKSPALVAFIVLETEGEFVGQFVRKDKALQMQVYGMWNTPLEFLKVTEKLRKVIPGVITVRRYVAQKQTTMFFDGERPSAALLFAKQRQRATHPLSTFAA